MVKTSETWNSRPVRDLRECCENVLSSPQLQRCESTRQVVMNRTGAGVELVSQAEDAQMPMWGEKGVEKGVPIIGVDYVYLWSRAPEASDAPQDEVAGEDPPDGVRTSSPVLLWKVQRASVALWSSLSGKR